MERSSSGFLALDLLLCLPGVANCTNISEVLHGWHNANTQSNVSFLAFLQHQSGFTPPQDTVPVKE